MTSQPVSEFARRQIDRLANSVLKSTEFLLTLPPAELRNSRTLAYLILTSRALAKAALAQIETESTAIAETRALEATNAALRAELESRSDLSSTLEARVFALESNRVIGLVSEESSSQ